MIEEEEMDEEDKEEDDEKDDAEDEEDVFVDGGALDDEGAEPFSFLINSDLLSRNRKSTLF